MSKLQTVYFEDLRVGMVDSLAKIISADDVVHFARISGDSNPIHLSEEFASQTRFGERVAQGFFTGSLISGVIGTRLPGPGTIYLSQTLRFKAPVRLNEEVLARVEVSDLCDEHSRVKLLCACLVRDVVVLEGEALVKAPRRTPVDRAGRR